MSTRIVERSAQQRTSTVRGAPRAHPASWVAVLLTTDVVLFIVASNLAALIAFHHWNLPKVVGNLVIAETIFVCLWVLVFDRLGLYRRTYALSMKDELYYTIAALIIGTIPQMVVFTINPGISTSRAALLYALAFSIVLVGSSRASLHRIRNGRWFNGSRRTSIVGTAEHVASTVEGLELRDEAETLLIVVDDLDETVRDIGALGEVDLRGVEWFSEARSWGCDVLILTEMLPPQVVGQLLRAAERERMSVAFAPPRMTRYAYDLSLRTDGHQALIVPAPLRPCTPRGQLVKRTMDITFACVALLLFAPVMALAAVAVYVESGWPIIFAQERVGLHGRVFSIWKFRSMQLDAERDVGAVWATATDPRKTRVGAFLRRFSIDELPQLFNVIQGDMSLVGPRPERPVFVELFRTTLPRYDERHLIRPGITGWSQIHMKRVLEPSEAGEKLQYDLLYLENWSPFLDISVMFQTLCEFLFHRAA
jgi:exopolysaccharide biosynthesis polyprenyl glycosylphosphotransferase